MAVSDGDYRFTYFDVGAYGSEGDGSIFQNCTLGKAIKQNLLTYPTSEENMIPYVFVSDDAFPLHRRIMKPYKPTKSKPLNENQQIFNYRLSRARRCIENAFGIMCSKYYCLSKTMFCGPDRAKLVIKTCAYLHNFLLRTRKAKYHCSNFRNNVPSGSLFHSNISSALQGREDDSGKIVRHNIKTFFISDEGSVSWQRKCAFLE